MLRRLSAVLVALTFGAGLDTSFADGDAVIVAHIVVSPTDISNCVVLDIYDTAGPLTSGSELAEVRLVRMASKDEYSVAIYQEGNFPAQITLRTHSHVGSRSGCADPLAGPGSLDVKTETFVVGKTIRVDLSLG